jgi:hypothetical protein
MNMKAKVIMTGVLLSSAQAMAAVNLPEICQTAVNFAAGALNAGFNEDGEDPATLTLKKDFVTFPITKSVLLGNCDEDAAKLKKSWCTVAGGSPDVYQVTVSENSNGSTFPREIMIVTYNRGGCFVDEVKTTN